MQNIAKTLKELQAIKWGKASVSFYIVKRKLLQRVARYEVLQVNIDEKLKKKLKSIVTQKISQSNSAQEYDFNTADMDDGLLTISTDGTDLYSILNDLQGATDPTIIDNYEALLESWLYISRLDVAGSLPLFSVRRTSESWTTKKVFQMISMIFQNNMLIDLEQEEIFRIDNKIDFFAYAGTIFIADKKNFETALNFREGMERNRDIIISEFHTLNFFENVGEIGELIGNNMRRLRKLSQVKKSGYYKDPNFLMNLKIINETDEWGLQYSPSGKLLVSEDNIEMILRILNNGRLTSKINFENFDVDVKHKI